MQCPEYFRGGGGTEKALSIILPNRDMAKLKTCVIVWGNDNYNVLGLLRQLTPYIENVFFLINGKRKFCASVSKFCKKHKVVSSISDGLDYLIKLGVQTKEKSFIIATSDLIAVAIDNNKGSLSRYYYLCTTKQAGLLTKAYDKDFQYQLAKRVGIRVPESKLFFHHSSTAGVSYPCLIKPAYKEEGVHHPFKTKICNDESDLRDTQHQLDKNGTYVIQQYINKDCDLLVYGCRYDNGDVCYAGVFIKSRWSGGDGSYGILSSEIPSCLDLRQLNDFLKEIDYCGLFSAEFGVEKGVAWFYEFNLRNDGTSHYFYQAGLANMPLWWIEYNLNCASSSPEKEITAMFIDEIGDYDNVRNGVVGLNDWKKQYKSATVFKYYEKDDTLPYYFMMGYYLLSRLYQKIKMVEQ